MSQLQFLVCESERRALASLNSDQDLIIPAFFSNEVPTYSVTRVTRIQNPAGARLWQPVTLAGYTLKTGIGNQSGVPIAGTFTLTFGANTTAGIAFDATAATVQTALNLLASVIAAGGLTVSLDADRFYLITFTAVGARAQITGDYTNLAPLSLVTGGTLIDGTASLQEVQTIRVQTQPAAYDSPSTAIAASTVTVTKLTTGGGGANAKYSIVLSPYPYDGSFTLQVPVGPVTPIISTSVANPTHIAASTGGGVIGHGLVTGDTVTIAGSGSTPTIDGTRTVTVLSTTVFTVPVAVTIAGTGGTVQRTNARETDFINYAASATDVATALAAIIGTGTISATKQGDGSWIIMFIGTAANLDMGTITADASALQSLTGVTGSLDLRVAAVDLLLGGLTSVSTDFEIELTPPAGAPFKVVGATAITLNRALISPGSASPPLIPISAIGYSQTITDLVGGTSIYLDSIVTTGIAVGYVQQFVRTGVGFVAYQLQAGTAATASPGIIRPTDYNGSTNQKIWIEVS